MTWLADPTTRQMAGPIPSREDELERRAVMAYHWRPGWLRRYVRDETGTIVRIAFSQCRGDCPCGEGRDPEDAP